ncbi:C-type lectin domain family 2 member B-like [Mantella aurantiaca]
MVRVKMSSSCQACSWVPGAPPPSAPCPEETTGRAWYDHVTIRASDGDSAPLCPKDWILLYNKCYYISTTTTNQPERNCVSRNSLLASVPQRLSDLRRVVTLIGWEFWVRIQKPDISWSSEILQGRWPDGSTEDIVGGVGSCVKLGQHLKMENCYLELRYICERDAAGDL